jgi:hypothetical protein
MGGIVESTNFWMSLLIAFLAIVLPGVMALLYWTVSKD